MKPQQVFRTKNYEILIRIVAVIGNQSHWPYKKKF